VIKICCREDLSVYKCVVGQLYGEIGKMREDFTFERIWSSWRGFTLLKEVSKRSEQVESKFWR
jgi:hypothetical protein